MAGETADKVLQEIYQSHAAAAVQILPDLFILRADCLREAWFFYGNSADRVAAVKMQSVVAGRHR